MANADRPRGFWPVGKIKSANVYESGSAIAPGEFVRIAADGQIDAVAAGETILGLALSYASGSGQDVLVCDDPEQRYIGQADETEIDAQTDVGNNCDVLATADNTTYKTARMEIDSSTIAASAAQLTILGIEKRPDNALGAQVDVVVRVNEHQLVDAFAGI
jgi:hypothetical protein